MKNVLLMTRNEGSDHIIEALMEHDDIHVVLEVAGTIEEKEIAERYSSRIDRIYAFLEGDLLNMECVDGLDYDLIDWCKEIETDFEDGMGRFVDHYALIKYKYYTTIAFWKDFFSKNKIDYMIIRGVTHGALHDSIPIYFANKKNIPCYQMENNYFSVGGVFLPGRREYMKLDLGMQIQLKDNMFYSVDFGDSFVDGNLLKDLLKKGLYKIGGVLLLQLVRDLLNRRVTHKLFGIDGSEHTIFEKILSYVKYKNTERYMKKLSKPFDSQKKYVIYYLQFEPEASIQVRCRLKTQLIAIKMLSEALPAGWKLYVKEHPHQFLLNTIESATDYHIYSANKYKNKKYYEKIASMKNTVLIDPTISSHDINKDAMAIATFNGTVSIEATELGKPILLFGGESTWLQYCKDVISIQSSVDCQIALDKIDKGWMPNYDDLEEVVNSYGYPLSLEGTVAVVDKIIAHEHTA